MAESQSKKRDSDHIRGVSSSGRFFKRRRGQWGHSRASINAALAIAPTTAPLATNGANSIATNQVSGESGTNSLAGQGISKQRHGRKRRRHRHSSFSGGGGSDKFGGQSYLPPALAAALAIPPKTPDALYLKSDIDGSGEQDNKKPDGLLSVAQTSNGGNATAPVQPTASAESVSSSAANGSGSGKKKKRRTRRKRRQWKPYYKLTAEERRELEEREEKRAERVRAQRFAHGQPVAPYNTTQFLLRDRELRNGGEPDCGDLDEIVRNIRHHTRSGSYDSPGAAGASESDGEGSTDNSDYSYLEREFDNDWLDEQRQRLEAMTKDDLVKEFMDLQKQYESAQRDMRSKRLSYEEQIAILQRDNNQLRSYCASLAPSRTVTAEMRQQQGQSSNVDGSSGARELVETVMDNVDDVNCSSSSVTSSEPVIVTLSLG